MQSRGAVLLAGLRRFFVILLGVAVTVTLITLLLAFLGKWDVDRVVSAGFDVVGAFLMVVGFFVGNRGPVRLKGEAQTAPFFGPRHVRWATPEERAETLNDSAVFVAVGLAMVVIGIVIDTRYSLI
jgi:hypothetical protein